MCAPPQPSTAKSYSSTDLPLQRRVTARDRRGQCCHGCGLGIRCSQCSRVCIGLAKGTPRRDSNAVVAGKAVLHRPSGRTAGRASRADNLRLFAVHADSVRHPRRPSDSLSLLSEPFPPRSVTVTLTRPCRHTRHKKMALMANVHVFYIYFSCRVSRCIAVCILVASFVLIYLDC